MIQLKKNTENPTGGQEPENGKHTESEQLQTYALEKENKSKYGKTVETEPIEGTPFTIITIDEGEGEVKIQECFIAIGNKRITERQSYIKCLEQIQQRDWKLITSLITVIVEAVIQEIRREDIIKIDEILKQNNGKEAVENTNK